MKAPAKKAAPVPEHILKKRKAVEQMQADRAQANKERKAKNKATRSAIFKRAASYVKEYKAAESNTIRMKRQARTMGNFYIEPQPSMMFVIRIRGINAVDPKTRKILQLLRLRQINNGVFLKLNKASVNMLKRVAPYVTFGSPNVKSIRELVLKRGFAKINGQRIPINDNTVIEQHLGQYGIQCVEDIVHEIINVGPNFKHVTAFLWPFQLTSPKGGFTKKRVSFTEGGDYGDREHFINDLMRRMN
jgi:large subunit ribosomal protein L7e